jgi:acylphosphatase
MTKKNGKPNRICVRCLVAGRVQGVFYRASARHQGQALGLTGYAQNLHDGRVEVMACGDPGKIEQFKAWLLRGPSGAQVSGVACEVVAVQEFAGFTSR